MAELMPEFPNSGRLHHTVSFIKTDFDQIRLVPLHIKVSQYQPDVLSPVFSPVLPSRVQLMATYLWDRHSARYGRNAQRP